MLSFVASTHTHFDGPTVVGASIVTVAVHAKTRKHSHRARAGISSTERMSLENAAGLLWYGTMHPMDCDSPAAKAGAAKDFTPGNRALCSLAAGKVYPKAEHLRPAVAGHLIHTGGQTPRGRMKW